MTFKIHGFDLIQTRPHLIRFIICNIMYEWNKETPLWCCACDCPNGPGHEQSQGHLSKLLEFTMATPDEQLRDILEEDERRSIRNTLASVVPAGATRKTSAVRIDPYESEVQGWLRAGMKWSEAKTIIGDELALHGGRGGHGQVQDGRQQQTRPPARDGRLGRGARVQAHRTVVLATEGARACRRATGTWGSRAGCAGVPLGV